MMARARAWLIRLIGEHIEKARYLVRSAVQRAACHVRAVVVLLVVRPSSLRDDLKAAAHGVIFELFISILLFWCFTHTLYIHPPREFFLQSSGGILIGHVNRNPSG